MITTHNNNDRPRVVVAMSGGVDSSVAAALMVAQGYDVIGMMLRLWSEPGQASFNRCCTPDQLADARRVADHLGIPFYAVDVQAYFRRAIVQFFIDGYAAGETPNPCIECNRQIRFGFLLDQARALGADYLATGHYARIRHTPANGYELWQGVDVAKDQSYVLHVIDQAALAQTLFPVGDYSKTEVRALAAEFGLPTAGRRDSMDLCFLGRDSYQTFLQRNAPEIARPGPIRTSAGETLGQHDGLPYYTIGQRKGLGVVAGEPLFVLRKDVAANALIVGPRGELGQRVLYAERVNWINGVPAAPLAATVRIRYKGQAEPATLTPLDAGRVQIEFDVPAIGAAAGQGAVFYAGERCLGGGLIRLPQPEPAEARA